MAIGATLMRGLLVCTLVLLSTQAWSQTGSDRIDQLERKLDQALAIISDLTSDIEQLKKERAVAAQEAPVTATAGERIKTVEAAVDDVGERMDEIEEVVFELDDKVGGRALVKAFDAVSLDIGGFLHSAFTVVDGADSSAASFNRQVFEFLARAELGPKWSAFLAQAFIRESDINFIDAEGRRDPSFTIATKSPTVIGWANYSHNDALNFRLGRQITPHGIINIEHFPALLLDSEQPMFLRPFGGQTMFPNFVTGLNVHGKIFTGFGGKGMVQYNVYAGNFAGTAEDIHYGGRIGYALGDTGFTVGANIGGGDRSAVADADFHLYGFDLFYDKGRLSIKSEVFFTDEEIGGNRFAVYAQPAWRIDDKWTAFYRFDFLDDGKGSGDRIENVIGLAYRPIPNTHLRGIVRFMHFDDEGVLRSADAQVYQLLATFSF